MDDSPSSGLWWAGGSNGFSRKMLAKVGHFAWEQWREVEYLAAVLGTMLFLSAQPRYWRRTVRETFKWQFFFFGVESIRFIVAVAVMVGLSVVVQLGVWTGKLGQSQKLGPLLVVVVARELGPLFANFVLIVRGGSAIVTELGIMKVGGEVRVLEAQGVEPLLFLVMPRVLAMALSSFCLSIVFVLVAFASGYGFGRFFGHANVDPAVFLDSVFKAAHPIDAFGFLAKCLLPALLTAVICATEGLSVEGGVTQVPQAAKRGLTRSLFALYRTSVAVSVLAYV
jgi:phospholipid/cholesterol/gamma-HCH transport system permease protein